MSIYIPIFKHKVNDHCRSRNTVAKRFPGALISDDGDRWAIFANRPTRNLWRSVRDFERDLQRRRVRLSECFSSPLLKPLETRYLVSVSSHQVPPNYLRDTYPGLFAVALLKREEFSFYTVFFRRSVYLHWLNSPHNEWPKLGFGLINDLCSEELPVHPRVKARK